MGLFGAMGASVAGLSAQGQAISVISDNLANTNTIGYKASRSLFSQMVTSSGVSGTTYNSGGVAAAVQRDQSAQGSFVTGSSSTDLAISGNGFFKVGDSQIGSTSTSYYYTRAGSFAEDKDGYLTNPQGLYLQGWKTDSDGTILNVQEPQSIELQSVGVSSLPTTEASIHANLNSSEDVSSIYDGTGSLQDALDKVIADPTKADYVTDIRVYDAQGGARDMTVEFTKNSANSWDWQLVTDGSNIQGGTAGADTRVAAGTIEFNTNGGSLKSMAVTIPTPSANGTVTIPWANGVDASTIKLNFGDYTGGKAVTGATAGLSYDPSDVLHISAENAALVNGTYTIKNTAADTFTLTLPDGTTVSAPVTIGASGNRELYFSDYGVRMTVGDNFNEDPGAGTYPVTVGTFAVSTQSALSKGVGTDGITQLAASYNTTSAGQNGFGAGTLASIAVDKDGYVNGTFTNGETKKLYKVALAVFQDPGGLEVVSGTLLRPTDQSGQALLKEPGVGGTGSIVGGSLEGSTTDIAGEFSNMIIAQRAFQASSKVITTVDQMLNDLLSLR